MPLQHLRRALLNVHLGAEARLGVYILVLAIGRHDCAGTLARKHRRSEDRAPPKSH